jgi:hypothetical protein
LEGMVNGLSERAVGQNGLIDGLVQESRWQQHQPGRTFVSRRRVVGGLAKSLVVDHCGE